MTDLLEHAVETMRGLSPEMQDEVARLVLTFTGHDQRPIMLTPEELADLEASDAEVLREEFATDEHMRAIWAKHGA